MGNFEELIDEAEEEKDTLEFKEEENKNTNSFNEKKIDVETNGAERAEEVGNEEDEEIEDKEEYQDNNEKQGFFSKLKNAFWTSPEDRQQKKMAKMKAEEEKINSELSFQRKKTKLAKKKAEIARYAKERRQNSIIGQTFTKLGTFVEKNTKQNNKVKNPLETNSGEFGIGAPSKQSDIYGKNAGINFGLIGRKPPQQRKLKQPPQQFNVIIKNGTLKVKKVKTKSMQQQTYKMQNPYSRPVMNTDLLNEFSGQLKDPFASSTKPNKKQSKSPVPFRW